MRPHKYIVIREDGSGVELSVTKRNFCMLKGRGVHTVADVLALEAAATLRIRRYGLKSWLEMKLIQRTLTEEITDETI